MLIKEYRIPLPLTVEEYRIGKYLLSTLRMRIKVIGIRLQGFANQDSDLT